MNLAQAAVLGAVQGVTEFLPVSSDGHLRLAEAALDAHPSSLLFDVSLHIGTLIAVVIVFRRELWAIVGSLRPANPVPWRQREPLRLLGLMFLASLPTAAVGLALEPLVNAYVPAWLVGVMLAVNGGILFLASWLAQRRRGEAAPATGWQGITPRLALLIGLAQGLAVLPGISRSGSTIATALVGGVLWRPAATFSFLLSVPAILGAVLLELRHWEALAGAELTPTLLGVVVALVVGLFALQLLLRLLAKGRLHWFAVYCLAIGLVATVWGLVSGA